MIRYSVQTRDRIFVKGYGFLCFTKNTGKNIGKNISKNLSRTNHAKRSATNALKIASKRIIPKTAEATGDLTTNKTAHKITIFSNYSQQNNSETVTNEHDKEIPKEKYISPEEKQEIIDDLR